MTTDQPERSARSAVGGNSGRSTRMPRIPVDARRFDPRTGTDLHGRIRSSGRSARSIERTTRRGHNNPSAGQRAVVLMPRGVKTGTRSVAKRRRLSPSCPGLRPPHPPRQRSEAEVPVPLLGAGLRPPDQRQRSSVALPFLTASLPLSTVVPSGPNTIHRRQRRERRRE